MQEQEIGGHLSRGLKINPNFQHVNKSFRISPNEVLKSWLINTVYHSLVKNKKGEGKGGSINFVPLNGGAAYYLRERAL